MDLKNSNYLHHLPEAVKLNIHSSMAKSNHVVEAPATPGRPVFSFSVGSRKNFPSKWDDAEKWLISGPAHVSKHKPINSVYHPTVSTDDQDHLITQPLNGDILLKDKLTNAEGFVLKEEVVDHRCPTPYKSVSPPRHTTPASMSGPLALSSSTFELQECHLAKLQPPGNCNWSSREEEEEDVSKSLRHHECPKTIPPCAPEEQETARIRRRYQREEAKIEAWVNLQNAKAEAESRKLEVKIQKMRSKFEEKMMKRMASVDRKAQELRAAARYDHNMQPPKKSKESLNFSGSCGCFPSSSLIYH